MNDPYATLGVARDADDDAIRSRYRELARRYHPDVNPGDASAEERFKNVSAAYTVLSDPEKKAAFDEFGEVALQSGFDVEAARRARGAFGGGEANFGGFEGFGQAAGQGGIEDLLSNLFGGAARGWGPGPFRPRSRAGADLEADLALDFVDAARGCEQSLTMNRQQPDGSQRSETLTVRIPPGVSEGGRVRLRGKGEPGVGGGPAGDLYARVHIRPHPVFRREDRHLYVDLPVSIREAVLGTKVEVPTLEGRVTLTIPPGTDSGTRLRLRGKGVPGTRQGAAGDLFAIVQIRVPGSVSGATATALEELNELEVANLRDDLLR